LDSLLLLVIFLIWFLARVDRQNVQLRRFAIIRLEKQCILKNILHSRYAFLG